MKKTRKMDNKQIRPMQGKSKKKEEKRKKAKTQKQTKTNNLEGKQKNPLRRITAIRKNILEKGLKSNKW